MRKKKILFLGGGSPGTCEMIQYAKKIGLHTIVTDWFDLSHSTAKRIADEHWEISFMDIDILEENVTRKVLKPYLQLPVSLLQK